MIKYFKVEVIVHEIGELQIIKRQHKGIPDLHKKVLCLETPDGQVLYPELRKNKLRQLSQQDITVGCKAEIEFSLWGQEKNGKRYNNIYLNSIKKL